VHPAIFGYLSVPPWSEDQEVRSWQRAVEAFAATEGYALAGIFTDVRGAGESGFYALMAALRHEEAVAVVVPDMGHLEHVACLAGADARVATRYLRARVLTVDATAPARDR
jgi:hypothetical protein